jgi:hypothetical protein
MQMPQEQIERAILVIRGHRVMLDSDLAKLLWRDDEGFKPGGQAECQTIPDRFCLLA